MSGWWFSASASSATWLTSTIACRNDGSSTLRSSAPPESIQSAENFILRWISPREGSSMHTDYLIVGGGMTAAAAARGIRDGDADGPITIVSDEPYPPYKRPWLSKKLWAGGDESKVWVDLPDVELRNDRSIVSLDLGAQTATDDQGEEYRYGKLLLATGGTPRRLGGRGRRGQLLPDARRLPAP